MDWLTRYQLRHFWRSSIWLAPGCALLCALLLARTLRFFDEQHRWTCFNFSPEGASAILSAFSASMLTFVVVVASSLMLVVQLVSANLTPRIIAPTFQNPIIRISLSMFVFGYVLSLAILARIGQFVPQLAVAVAVSSNVLSLILFFYFVGKIGMGLRPAEIMSRIASKGRVVIYDIYPQPCDASDSRDEAPVAESNLGAVTSVIPYLGSSGVLLAFDSAGMLALASRHRAIIEMVPRVGDWLADGEPLFRIYGCDSIDAKTLRRMIAMGPERTLEQDPRLAFRIIVDIACKALSPAINDPTTGVLAIDQIHRLLRWVGSRKLHSGSQPDASGTVRLIFSTPSWEDFVWLATSDIRQYGGDNLRVCQRLRAMLEHLINILPEPRRAALAQQLELLNDTVERNFVEPADRNRVRSGASRVTGASTDA